MKYLLDIKTAGDLVPAAQGGTANGGGSGAAVEGGSYIQVWMETQTQGQALLQLLRESPAALGVKLRRQENGGSYSTLAEFERAADEGGMAQASRPVMTMRCPRCGKVVAVIREGGTHRIPSHKRNHQGASIDGVTPRPSVAWCDFSGAEIKPELLPRNMPPPLTRDRRA